MKIAYFIGTLKKEDGVARVLLMLVREAQKRSDECVIITGSVEDRAMTTAPIIEIPSIAFPLYKEYKLPLPGMKGFEKQLREFAPDIIHIHSPDTSAWAAVRFAKKYRIPIVATHHTDFMRDLAYYHVQFLKPLVSMLLRRLYHHMHIITTPSSITTHDLTEMGVNRLETIPWGVDLAHFAPHFRSEQWRKKVLGERIADTFIILCVCRLAWEKNLRVLADTYTLLRKQRDDFVMVVAGEGPARKELEQLMPGAIFRGYLEEAELSETYASTDIFLFPSSRETFGNVTIEAMASGLAPVVADAGGSKTIVTHGRNGLLADPRSAQDFAQKVTMLLNDRDLQEKIKYTALEDARHFTWERVFERMFEIYRQMISANKPL